MNNNTSSVSPAIIKDRNIKIALVGCGRISAKHFEAIQHHSDNLVLDAVCDIEPTAVQNAVNNYHCNGYATLTELLKYSNADIVTLCTPSGLHAKQTIQIAHSGKHIITEKPMATRWQDGLTMVNTCDEVGVKLFVVKQNRLNATLQALKQAVVNQRFGKIYLVNINVMWTRPQSYYDQGPWRGTWEFDGGALMNQASHYLDLLHWLFGPVATIQAMTATLARAIETEDTGVLNIKWRSGALGSVNVTMLTHQHNFEGSITVIGEKGTVRLGGIALNEIQHWEFQDTLLEDQEIKAANYKTDSVYGFGHTSYYKNVIDVLRGTAKPVTDGRSGLKTLELLIAAYRSARDLKNISLPLEY